MIPRSVERRRWLELDRSPTGNRRRLTEEEPMSNPFKLRAARALIVVTAVAAVVAVPFVADQGSQSAGRKWGSAPVGVSR